MVEPERDMLRLCTWRNIPDRKLDAVEAARNYAAGLPQTPALAYAVEATVNEDGEAIAGSLLGIAPKLYAAPLPASRLGTVALQVVDLDEAPGYPANQPMTSTAMVATLPENGEILHVDGTPIKVGDVLDPPRLLARPPLDAAPRQPASSLRLPRGRPLRSPRLTSS